MIVYVESNFVLELALGQEQAQDAEAILALAETGSIRLAIPSFALSEPFTTIRNRANEREKLASSLAQQKRELGRSAQHKQLNDQLDIVVQTLTTILITESDRLQQGIERLLKVGELAELSHATLLQARQYEANYRLKSQDAIIYALIAGHLLHQDNQEPKCFSSRDIKAFEAPEIKAELAQFNCRYIGSFTNSLNYIQSELNKTPGS